MLSNSIKGVQARIWHGAGIPTPAHIRIGSFEELATIPERIDFPIIVRSDILHAQEGLRVCRDEQDLRRITRETLPLPASVSKLIDVPGSYSPHQRIGC
jgi:biotin carboxylase